MKILVTMPDGVFKEEFLTTETKALLEENFEVIYNEIGRNYTSEEMFEAASDVDIVLTCWGTPTFIGGPIENNKSIKLIAHTAGSVANLVDEAVYNHGIRVISGNQYFAESVAEGTIAYMLSSLRRIPDDVYDMRHGMLWKTDSPRVTAGLLDRDIGIVGFGMIARKLVEMLKPFRANIKIYSAYPIEPEFLKEHGASQVSLQEAFSCSIVSLHSALTDATRGMIGREHLELIPEGGIFINTARGAIVREGELIEVLKNRNIFALLDVYEVEPLPLQSELRSLSNVYPLPHRGGPTNDRRPYIGKKIVEDLIRFKKGEPLLCEISAEYAKRMTKQ